MKKSKSDAQLIKEIKQNLNISENFKELSERHSGIYFYIVNKLVSDKFIEKKLDFRNDKDYYMFMAILEFDESKKTKFSTYLGNKIKWMCINDFHKTNNRKTSNADNNELDTKRSTPPLQGIEREDIDRFFNLATMDADARILKIFSRRYLEGKGNKVMPWRDVCQGNGINLSIQGCINVHNKFLKKVKTQMDK